MSARDLIRQQATNNGWTLTDGYWSDVYTRTATLPPGSGLARLFNVSGHTPTERVFVAYAQPGWVTQASYSRPGEQSLIDGTHSSSTQITGRNRKDAILSILANGVPE